MYAVFSTGGKQYRASTGDKIKVEKLEAEKGAEITLDQVLMIGEGEDVTVGAPFVDGGKVTAKVVDHGRGEKIRIIKFKRRKNHEKQMGHRQYYTEIEITGIDAPGKKSGGKKKAASKKKAESKPAAEQADADNGDAS